MQLLVEKIKKEGVYVGGGIIKVDALLNHQVDVHLMSAVGKSFAKAFATSGATMVLTAESSGIPPAFAVAQALGIPLVYARKKPPLTMSQQVYHAEAPSRTKGGVTPLIVSADYMTAKDRVLLIDDFLASGLTGVALLDIVEQSGATLVGVGCVVEKVFEPGRERLEAIYSGPIVSLAKIDLINDGAEIHVYSGN